ncbi:MAG TPA: HAMP domain-containing sensor histidine kinase, partial [Longimicrobiaceae bacterium]|nr:HAMP domain-containing sensor histidine kinase [Longimicrobiaceae bacterium]
MKNEIGVTEEEPRRAASLPERVLRQMPAAVAVVDAGTGLVVLASERAEEGGGPPGFPGPGAALRLDGTPYTAGEWPLERSLRAGETVPGEEVAFRREDGSTAVYLLFTAPVRDAAARIVAGVALWVEVTGARRAAAEHEDLLGREREARQQAVLARTVAEAAQLEAQAADTAKSSFLASMSHEIRTPINAIMGYTDLLDLGLSGPVTEGQHAQLARIRDSSRHLLSLVNEVLDVAKIDAGEMEVDREPGRLADAVDAALHRVRPQAAERGLALSERCEGDPGAAFVGDAGRVRQIAANLLSNAVKFTPAGGRVRVSCGIAPHPHGEVFATHAGPWAYLAVEDNGIGIPPALTSRIFEPFVQAEEGRTRRAGGTGLGLTISRKLARLMKGDLTVRSQPGEGSTFTLWLPAADAAEPPSAEPAAGRAAPPRIHGIAGIGMRMLDEVDSVCQRLVERFRADPPVPHLDAFPDSVLRNHFAALVTDAVQCLVILEESPDDAADLMLDGSAIQRTIADRHGLQRHRLGWTEEGVREDYRVLMEEVEACALEAARDVPDPEPELALSLLRSFVQQAVNISIRAFRIARRAD